jgi:hypothetical protein
VNYRLEYGLWRFPSGESPVVFISASCMRRILISNGEVILTPIAKSLVS